MRAWLVVAVAACSHPTALPSRVPVRTPRTVVVASPHGPIPTIHHPRSAAMAPPAGELTSIATTPDGTAALTVDQLGGARLWPTLDGTQEPHVVELPQGIEDVEVARRDGGFTAVVRDEVGGLYIARLDGDGRTLSHVTLAADAGITAIAMSSAGLLAARADQHVLLIDGDGAVIGDIAAEARQRVGMIAASGAYAVAVVEVDGGMRARLVTLQPHLAWGAWLTVSDPVDPIAVAIAPDGKHVALATRNESSARIEIIDNAGADVVAKELDTVQCALAFATPSLLAILSQRGDAWLEVAAKAELKPMTPLERPLLLAGGAGQVVRAQASDLVLDTVLGTQYLGYQTLAPLVSTPGPDGKLLVAGTPSMMLLDAQLRETSSPAMGLADGYNLADVAWLGADDYLVLYASAAAKSKLALVNAATGTHAVVRDNLSEVSFLGYEPTTSLATMSFGASAQLARVDRHARTVDSLTPVKPRAPYKDIVYAATSPERAGGTQVVEILVSQDLAMRWYAGVPGKDKPTASTTVHGAYLGADATGNVYAWHPNAAGALEAVIYNHGKLTGTLPTRGAARLWPRSDGGAVLEGNETGLVLYRSGTVAWTRAMSSPREAHWLTDGSIAIVHPTGIARIDAATGTVTASRCGWQFGLTENPHPPSPANESLCAQLVR